MTVEELREKLARMPGHWPVHVAIPADEFTEGDDVTYHYTLDLERGNFPTQGNMAVIILNQNPR